MASKKDNQKFAEILFEGSTLLDTAADWIRDNLKPDQVFDDKQLEQWAEANGFVKEAP